MQIPFNSFVENLFFRLIVVNKRRLLFWGSIDMTRGDAWERRRGSF
jgi:hypothetical protein